MGGFSRSFVSVELPATHRYPVVTVGGASGHAPLSAMRHAPPSDVLQVGVGANMFVCTYVEAADWIDENLNSASSLWP